VFPRLERAPGSGCGVRDLKALGTVWCPRLQSVVSASDYHPSRDLVSLGYGDGRFELRRGATRVLACGAHAVKLSNLVFSLDGSRLATADIAGRVAVSNLAEREIVPLLELPSEIFGLAFSAGSRHGTAGSGDPLQWAPVGLRFAPDGSMAVFARDRFYLGPAEPARLADEYSTP